MLGAGEGVIDWWSIAVVVGTPSILVCMASSEPKALLFLDHIWGTRQFFKSASLSACLRKPPLSPFAHSQGQCLESVLGICSPFRINSCPLFSSEHSRVASFSGKRQESFIIPDSHHSPHPQISYLYYGILFSSGNHRFLLFYICH